MEQALKHKFYKPISQEKIEEAVKEINKERHDFLDIETLIAEDKFVIFYHEGDKTLAPEKDIQIHSGLPPKPNGDAEVSYIPIPEENTWFALAKENWQVSIPLTLFVIWIIGKYFGKYF